MAKKFVMSDEAIDDNYGEKWRGIVLEVTHTATKYMPAKEFYAKGMPQGYHPGYDTGVSPSKLYDLKRVDTGESLPFSLYDWEVQSI